MIQIDLLRHGACEGGEIFRGSSDVALSDEGWQQMHASVNRLAQSPWDAIVSSPLQRCHAFAEKLSADTGLPLRVDDDWRELSFGAWEGRLREEIFREDGAAAKAFYLDPAGSPPPGGESGEELQQRVLAAWQRALDDASDRRVLVVTHGGVIRALMTALLGMPIQSMFALDVPYACMSGLHYIEKTRQTRLLFHSHSEHSL